MKRIASLVLVVVLLAVGAPPSAALSTEPTWDIDYEVSCDQIRYFWTAENVEGWTLHFLTPPRLTWHWEIPFTEPTGEVTGIEPFLFGTDVLWLTDEHDEEVPGSRETHELTRPPGCGPVDAMVVGGTAVVSDQVATGLDALTRNVERLAGPDRYATAVALAKAHWPYDGFGQPVFIATGENFPDALAGGPAAADWAAPILLVRRDAIPAVTAAELERIDPYWITILGGTAVVSPTVENQLAGYTDGDVYRLAGPNRYATAATISAATFDPGVDAAYIATGANFPDALAGGPAAAADGGPILLVQKNSIPAATADELWRLDPNRIYILGGTAVVANTVANQLRSYTTGPVTRLAGPDRYATAAAIVNNTFPAGQPSRAYIATGENFPDGLTAGPIAGAGDWPILLVRKHTIPPPTTTELQRLAN